MSRALILVAYVTAIPAATIGWISLALWLSVESHHFGPWDPRYLLLFYGSDVAELDLIDPIDGSVRYSGQGQEGTAPHYAYVRFKTAVAPEQVIDPYEARCSAIGLVPQRVAPEKHISSEPGKLILECTREESELGIEAKRIDGFTEVTIGGWESE